MIVNLNGLARGLMLAACAGAMAAHAAERSAPATERHAVTDEYHQVRVIDDYRWLEDGNSAKVRAWSRVQDAYARRYLDALPVRAAAYRTLMRDAAATGSYYGDLYAVNGSIFASFHQPPKQQAMIAILSRDLDPAQARIVVDPNAMNDKGTTAIDWWVPSPNGRLLAVSLSQDGSEIGTLHIFDAATGSQVGAPIPRVQFPTGGGSVAWRNDSSAFWYTRYPGEERPAADRQFFQQIYFHKMGDDPSQDSYVLGKELPKVAEIVLHAHFNPNTVVASVANGDGGEYAHYLLDMRGRPRQLTRFEDKVDAVTVSSSGAIYLVSRKGAPRGQLLRLEAGGSDLSRAKLLIPESDGVLQGGADLGGEPVVVTGNFIYVRELAGGPSRINIFDLRGLPRGVLPAPDVAAVAHPESLGDGTLLYSIETYLRPEYFARYLESNETAIDTPLARRSPVSFDDAEAIREHATSKDGTPVPLNIIRRKDAALQGSNPLLLYGYGGFGISETPQFVDAVMRLWLDGGGVFVDANLRGGGEFGASWHEQGMLTHKQNVFDDFIAAAEHLIAQGYTDREHLAIMGGSNGGLLMGAVMTQRPELFRAVVSEVGIYDMLRVESDANGEFNTMEYGSVRDADQFKALFAYSPYQHVKDGTAYPAVFMQTGATDGRVNPAQSRKMLARLQAASSSGRPVLLSIDAHAGHGIGSALNVKMSQQADSLSFLFDQLGMHLPLSANRR